MDAIETIKKVRSGVAQVTLERNRERISSGNAFLVPGGLVTNSHVIRQGTHIEAIAIRFADSDPADPASYIRLLPDTIDRAVDAESPEEDKDFAHLAIEEPEFAGRHRFTFAEENTLSVGEQVVFLGFPFSMPQLTSHIGYVSSIHERDGIEIIQIDGSVNGGNSGGPLLDLKTGAVAGIVTRSVTGIIEQQFNQLIAALRQNQTILAQRQLMGSAKILGIDPLDALRASQAAMEHLAKDLKKSANVGIGYAYAVRYVRDTLSPG